MFEIRLGELRATFLRNHNMRRHKDPTRKTAQAEDNSSPEGPRNPDNRHKHGGTAPVTCRCTRYVAVHPNRRGVMPADRVQCPNIQEKTRNWHTEPLTAAPLHAQLGPTSGRMSTPPTPPPALRPTPTPPSPLHAKSPFSRTRAWNRKVATASSRHARVRSVRIYSVQMRGDNR